MKNKILKNRANFTLNRKQILIDSCIMCLFLLISYLIISSKYNFMIGDAGDYAFRTRILYERHKLDLSYSTALAIGQYIIGFIFSLFFGFSLKALHISAYFVAFFCMLSFYFLLLQIEIDGFSALIASLTIFINPISLKLIDWYMTEPFFLFYFFLSMNFFIAGFKSGKAKYFYIGAFFSTIAIFTRQFAVSLSLALIILLLFERRRLKKNFIPILLSAILPLTFLALYYLKSKGLGETFQIYSPRAANLKRMINPLYTVLLILKDALHTLHYSAVYAMPLIIILLIATFYNKEYLKKLLWGKGWKLIISIFFMVLGTFILYINHKKLMPYLPSIFGVSGITQIFGIKILDDQTASVLFTIFSTIGGIIIFYKILESIEWNKLKNFLQGKDESEGLAIARYFIYITGILFFLINSATFLIYERYIFPVAIFLILFIVLKCNWIRDFKKTAFITFLIIYSIFIFNMKKSRMTNELIWDAANYLIEKGVKPIEIRGGCGFGFYYNFYEIYNMYKDVKINRPVNWHKFHPLANYFISNNRKAGNHRGLELIHSLKNESYFNKFKYQVYIFKRKSNFKDLIWVQ